jgi:hypothetical protein
LVRTVLAQKTCRLASCVTEKRWTSCTSARNSFAGSSLWSSGGQFRFNLCRMYLIRYSWNVYSLYVQNWIELGVTTELFRG